MSALFLIAHIAGRGIAIAAGQVESVVDLAAIVRVPRAGAAIRGIAALRSRVVTVIDTWEVLGLERPERPDCRAIISLVEGHEYAFLVDTIEDVATFDPLPLPSGLVLSDAWAAAARGLVRRDGEPILIVDPAALAPLPEIV